MYQRIKGPMHVYGQSFGSAQRADVQLKRIKNNEHLENTRFGFHFTFKINLLAGTTAQCYHTQCLAWVAMGSNPEHHKINKEINGKRDLIWFERRPST